MSLGGPSATPAADPLVAMFCAGGMLVGAHNGAVDEDFLEVGVASKLSNTLRCIVSAARVRDERISQLDRHLATPAA